jgi:hypothetical protein
MDGASLCKTAHGEQLAVRDSHGAQTLETIKENNTHAHAHTLMSFQAYVHRTTYVNKVIGLSISSQACIPD